MNDPKHRPFVLVHCREMPRGFSPYRVCDRDNHEIGPLNQFLDAQATRGFSPCSLRAYGYSLLNFWRWLTSVHKELSELCARDLFEDYVRFQRGSDVEPAATTINHRLTVACCLYRYHTGRDLPLQPGSQLRPYHCGVASPSGHLYPARRKGRQARPKLPQHVIVPLTRREVRDVVESFSTWRDLAIVSLMLLCGLRSREVIDLLMENLDLDEARVRVRGKGNRDRVVPLPDEVCRFLRKYFELERPLKAAETVFVSLKRPNRGQRMTPAGLRSLFRYHRASSGIQKANPHRFRHTFGAEMAAAGINLPSLRKLMGHSDINTTMRYVEIPTPDVHAEFRRVLKLREALDESNDDGSEQEPHA